MQLEGLAQKFAQGNLSPEIVGWVRRRISDINAGRKSIIVTDEAATSSSYVPDFDADGFPVLGASEEVLRREKELAYDGN